MPLLARSLAAKKNQPSAQREYSWAYSPSLWVCYIILVVYGLFLASVCQYWGVLMALTASWRGSACLWATISVSCFCLQGS